MNAGMQMGATRAEPGFARAQPMPAHDDSEALKKGAHGANLVSPVIK
jgi:hypothetical protein